MPRFQTLAANKRAPPSHTPTPPSPLPYHRHEWPQWTPQDLSRIMPQLEPEGIDLLKKMLDYDPIRRISVGVCS